MNQTKMKPHLAMNMVVCKWVQQMEDVHFRTEATLHCDSETGDEFITIYDPLTDVCITVWRTPAWFGNDVLELVRTILAPKLKEKGGPQ